MTSLPESSVPQAAPQFDEWRQQTLRLAERIEAAGYQRGLVRRAPSDHEPEIIELARHLAAHPASPAVQVVQPAQEPVARIDPMQNPMRPAYFIGGAGDEHPSDLVLRKLACWLGVGGFNAPTVDAGLFHRKIVDGIEYLLKDARAAAPQPAPAQPAPVVPQEVPMLLDDDMQALKRFCETCEDGQPYDVSKDRMRRLAELGAIQWCGASRYSMTAFGQYVLDLLPDGWPRLPLKTHADHDADSRASFDAAMGKTIPAKGDKDHVPEPGKMIGEQP